MGTRPAKDSTGRSRRSTPGGRLLRSDEYADALLPAYYAVLNEHEDAAPFRRALAELHARLRLDVLFRAPRQKETPEEVSTRRRREAEEEEEAEVSWPWKPQDAWIPEEARRAIDGFIARWRLPCASSRDVAYSLPFTSDGAEPRLVEWVRTYIGTAGYAYVTASAPEPFRYTVHDDPAEMRAKARQRAEAVYAQMVRQMEEQDRKWREAGRRPLHPQHRSEEATRTVALRLFRRAILEWSWQDIARAEYPPPPAGREQEPVPDSAVRESVHRWASTLGVRLPEEQE